MASLMTDVDLLKLDIEGQEFEVLRSVADVLIAHRPTVVVEVLKSSCDLRHFLAELAQTCSYSIAALGAEGLRIISPEQLLTTDLMREYGTRDVALLREDALKTAIAG